MIGKLIRTITGRERTGRNEFLRYGHLCEIPEDMDDVAEYYSENTFKSRMAKYFFQLRMVSDISKSYTHHLRSHGSIMKERKRHLLHYNYIIHPYSYFRVMWEFFILLVTVSQFILVPIDVGFYGIKEVAITDSATFTSVLLVNDVLLCVDIVVNSLTGYYSEPKKEIILDFKQIFIFFSGHSITRLAIAALILFTDDALEIETHYLKTLFFVDLISSFPTHYPHLYKLGRGDTVIFVFKVCALTKLLRFITFVKYYGRLVNFLNFKYSVSSLVMVLVGVMIYWHTLTCYLIYVKFIDFYRSPGGRTTLFPAKIMDSDYRAFHIYVKSFYKASMVIYTSWYTKDTPEGNIEFVVITLMWYFSKAIQFFILARTLQIMKGTNSSHQKYVEMERQLKEYMRDKQLPAYMRTRLLMYYDFRFQRHYFKESEILATISGQLRQEIIMHSCRQLVENVAFFKNLPINLLVRIVSCLRGEMYLINDVIVRANTPGDCMYFIASGTVAVYSSSGKEICHLEDGSHFGEIALVNKAEARIASVVAIEICEVYRFDVKDFVRAIHPYPDLLDSIERIAADRMEKTMMLDEHNRREMASKRPV